MPVLAMRTGIFLRRTPREATCGALLSAAERDGSPLAAATASVDVPAATCRTSVARCAAFPDGLVLAEPILRADSAAQPVGPVVRPSADSVPPHDLRVGTAPDFPAEERCLGIVRFVGCLWVGFAVVMGAPPHNVA